MVRRRGTRARARVVGGLRLLLAVVLVAAALPLHTERADAYAGAPWFQPNQPYSANFPDPSLVWDQATGRYYAFGTTTGGVYVPAMWSTDLVNWTAAPNHGMQNGNGQAHDALPVPDAQSIAVRRTGDPLPVDLWAPGVKKIGSTWVMFYALRVDGAGRRCLWYATSSAPMGPYTNPTYFYCSGDPMGTIDPEPFVDTDGTPYLIYKDEGLVGSHGQRIWARRISVGPPGPGAVSWAPGSSPALLLESEDTWEAYVAESPSVVRHNGVLRLFYSGNAWESDEYATGMATCSALVGAGPLCTRDPSNPIQTRRQPTRKGVGAPSAVVGPGNVLHLATHSWREGFAARYPTYPLCTSQSPTFCTENQRRLTVERVQFQFARPIVDSATGPSGSPSAAAFTPITPTRVLDTRLGRIGPLSGTRRAAARGEVVVLDLAPSTPAGATAAVLNVTAADTGGEGWITVYPCGDVPYASSVSFAARRTVPNLVTVRLNPQRRVCLYAYEGAHLLADLAGSFSPSGSSRLVPLDPKRLLDTRTGIGTGGVRAPIAAGATLEVQVTGRENVPLDATAAVLNVTAVAPDIDGYLTVYPCGTRPDASNVNYRAGQTVPNLATVALSGSGRVCVFSERRAHVLIDVSAAYSPSGAAFTPLSPTRVFDTRAGAPIGARQIRSFPIRGLAGVPPQASAVVLNLTATDPGGTGYLTVFPCGTPPDASNLNRVAGETVANLVVARLAADGSVCVFSETGAHVLADVAGWYA